MRHGEGGEAGGGAATRPVTADGEGDGIDRPRLWLRSRPLDDRERRMALTGAAVAAAASVALYAPSFRTPAAVALAAIGVAMAGLLALAARARSRVLTGTAAVVVAFGPWGYAWLVGLPYFVLAGWLLFRGPRLAPAGGGGRARRAARGGGGDPRQPSGPRRPPANKRYTPPGGRGA